MTTSAASIKGFSSKNSQFSLKVVRLSLINLDFSLSPSVSMICYNWQRKITISKNKFLLHLEWNLCQHSKIKVRCTFGILTSKKLPFQRKDFKLQLITLEYWCFYIGYFTQKYSMKSILSLSYSSNNKELSIKYIISVKKFRSKHSRIQINVLSVLLLLLQPHLYLQLLLLIWNLCTVLTLSVKSKIIILTCLIR